MGQVVEDIEYEDDYLEDNQPAYNLAQDSDKPYQKINFDLLNQVRYNFLTYDDFDIFYSGLPASLTAPLR